MTDLHFSQLKHLAKSPLHFRHACDATVEPTRAMRIGSAVHALVLGQPNGRKVIRFSGEARRGDIWTAFERTPESEIILTSTEWLEAEEIANAVKANPLAQTLLAGARCEVPLSWTEGDDLRCSTRGIDILTASGGLGELKTTTSTEPEAWKRQAFSMYYPQQLVFYRRGALANGIPVSKDLFLLGVETRAPFDVVVLELTEAMIDLAERTVTLWLEKLRVYRESNQWPGYAQGPVPFDPTNWMRDDEGEDE